MLIRLAILNVCRNRRRSFITVLAVGVGLSAMVFLWAFMDGYQEEQRENAIGVFSGHVQINARGFHDTLSPELVLPDRAEVLSTVSALPGVVATTERIRAEALLGTASKSNGVLLLGIDPVREARVTKLNALLGAGRPLAEGDDRAIVLGTRLASKVGAIVGDKVVLMTQARDGSLSGYSYRVKGLLQTGSGIDQFVVLTTLSAAQELLGFETETEQLVVRLTDRRAIPDLRTAFEGAVPEGAYELLSWDEIIPEINQWANWAAAITRFMLTVFMVVIAVGVMNTVLMSVAERTKEIGVMLALGTRPEEVLALILLETASIASAGTLLGLAGGCALAGYFGSVGIRFEGFEEAARQAFMSPVVYPEVRPERAIGSGALLLAVTCLAGLYPAWKASRTEPVKAIYHST
jgi:ABC-type lipoprotein release transport system permease subunit